MSDAGDHWNRKFSEVLTTKLHAKQSKTDRSLYHYQPHPANNLLGMLALYVEDGLYAGEDSFFEKSKVMSATFD